MEDTLGPKSPYGLGLGMGALSKGRTVFPHPEKGAELFSKNNDVKIVNRCEDHGKTNDPGPPMLLGRGSYQILSMENTLRTKSPYGLGLGMGALSKG